MTDGFDSRAALVLYSGGQDSATCLAWALAKFDRVETVGFKYGQVHDVEMQVRRPLGDAIARLGAARGWPGALAEDHVIDASVLSQIAASTLTGSRESVVRSEGLPSTFVPGRNLLFLTLAAALAYRRGLKHVVTGVCETDYSGYPDCRDDTLKALQVALSLGMDARVVIDTPLMWVDKAETWELSHQLGGAELVEAIRTGSHTCYAGDRSRLREWGYGCGECAACELRAGGWARFQARRPPRA